jgi:hypothetical protein
LRATFPGGQRHPDVPVDSVTEMVILASCLCGEAERRVNLSLLQGKKQGKQKNPAASIRKRQQNQAKNESLHPAAGKTGARAGTSKLVTLRIRIN